MVTLNELADLIVSPAAEPLLSGNYLNRRGIRGFYLQLKCGNHWCKVSVSHADRHSARVTVEELDQITEETLIPGTVAIPRTAISTTLRSAEAEQARIQEYTNSSAVAGIWAEFYRSGNWYMISLSHVEVSVYATRKELERIADEFLRQQSGRTSHRRGTINEF